MHWAFLFTATFGDCFLSRIFCSLLLANVRDPGSAVSPDDETCLRPTKTIRRQSSLSALGCYSFFILCGLCIGHSFLLHRSGMVFVPSIMSELHIGQRFPVGFALMAYLQSG